MSFEEWKFRQHIGEVQDEYGGCFDAILKVIALGCIIAAITWCFSGCKTIKVGQSHDKDSVRVEYRVDSFTHVIRDSVRVQLPCSDSIEVAYVDRWHTEYKDRTIKLHDTIRVCSTDTIYQPYPVKEVVTKNSGFAKFCIWHTIILWIILAIGITIWILLKVYLPKWPYK